MNKLDIIVAVRKLMNEICMDVRGYNQREIPNNDHLETWDQKNTTSGIREIRRSIAIRKLNKQTNKSETDQKIGSIVALDHVLRIIKEVL